MSLEDYRWIAEASAIAVEIDALNADGVPTAVETIAERDGLTRAKIQRNLRNLRHLRALTAQVAVEARDHNVAMSAVESLWRLWKKNPDIAGPIIPLVLSGRIGGMHMERIERAAIKGEPIEALIEATLQPRLVKGVMPHAGVFERFDWIAAARAIADAPLTHLERNGAVDTAAAERGVHRDVVLRELRSYADVKALAGRHGIAMEDVVATPDAVASFVVAYEADKIEAARLLPEVLRGKRSKAQIDRFKRELVKTRSGRMTAAA